MGFPTGDSDVEPAALSNVQDIQADYSAQLPADLFQTLALEMSIDAFLLSWILRRRHSLRDGVKPGNSLVHHVLIYAIDPTQKVQRRPMQRQSDQATNALVHRFQTEVAPTILRLSNSIGAWVPGIEPAVLPAGAAFRVCRF